MEKQILFIQGGGKGAYEEDKKLADNLQKALGETYNVQFPKLPDEDNPKYAVWKNQIAKKVSSMDGALIFVGHSLGASRWC